jgi:cell division septation protein DedD
LGHLVDLCVRIVLGHSESAKRALKYEQDRYERSQASEEEWQDLSHELNHEIKEFASHLTEEEEWQDLNHEPEESGRQTTGETETAVSPAPSPEPAEQPRATEEPETPQESTEEPSEPDTSAAAPEAHEEPSPAAEPPARPAQPKPNPFFADALARLKSLQEMREARNQRELAAREAEKGVSETVSQKARDSYCLRMPLLCAVLSAFEA